MNPSRCSCSSFAIAVALLCAAPRSQIVATYTPFGSGCPGTGTGLGVGHVAPAAFATAFAPSNNVMGLSGTPSKYQQVFLASELPTAFTMGGVALRWDNQTMLQIYGATVDLEIAVGYTTKTPTTLDTTFANNFDQGAPVTVLPRSFVVYPDNLTPPPTNPAQWQLVIPWTTSFAWAPQPGQNLLIQFVQRGSTSPGFAYVLDCGWSTATARLYGSDTATTGMLDGYGYGYPMSFLEVTHTAVPALTNTDFPQLGGQFNVRLAQARPSAFTALVLGFSRTAWNGSPLPLDLGGIGAAGCQAFVALDQMTFLTTNASGKVSYQYSVPMNLSYLGLHFFNQFAIAEPTVNAFGFVVSNAGEGVIGT